MSTDYPYLDKCDGCSEKMWVRPLNDGDSQYCIKCDSGECPWCFGDGCAACDDALIEVSV